MKYIKTNEGFKSWIHKLKIDKICKKYDIKNYTINSNGLIDADDDVWFNSRKLRKLPLKFNKVSGWFGCDRNELISLEGSPKEVNNNFNCNRNRLTSFKYAPKIVRGHFNCEFNNIKTFEYFPSFIKGDFYCIYNPIWHVWNLFEDTTQIELLNDFDVFREEDTNEYAIIIMDRLNDFLLTIGKKEVKYVYDYRNK